MTKEKKISCGKYSEGESIRQQIWSVKRNTSPLLPYHPDTHFQVHALLQPKAVGHQRDFELTGHICKCSFTQSMKSDRSVWLHQTNVKLQLKFVISDSSSPHEYQSVTYDCSFRGHAVHCWKPSKTVKGQEFHAYRGPHSTTWSAILFQDLLESQHPVKGNCVVLVATLWQHLRSVGCWCCHSASGLPKWDDHLLACNNDMEGGITPPQAWHQYATHLQQVHKHG